MKSKGAKDTLVKVKETILFRRFLGASVVGMVVFVMAFVVAPYIMNEANAAYNAEAAVTWKSITLSLDPDYHQGGASGTGDVDFGEVIPTSKTGTTTNDNVGSQKVTKKDLKITTTGSHYAVYLSMSGNDNTLVEESDSNRAIDSVNNGSGTYGTFTSPIRFYGTGWGYAVPGSPVTGAGFAEASVYEGYESYLVDLTDPDSNNMTKSTHNSVYNTGTWAAVPKLSASSKAQEIWENSTADPAGFSTGDVFSIYYSVVADTDVMAGNYKNNVVYTVLASTDDLDRASNNIKREVEFAASGKTETLRIDLATTPESLTTSQVSVFLVPHDEFLAGGTYANYTKPNLTIAQASSAFGVCTPTAVTSLGQSATITCTLPNVDGSKIEIADNTTTLNGAYDFWVHIDDYNLDYISKYTSEGAPAPSVIYAGLQSKHDNGSGTAVPYITTMQEMTANICQNTNRWGTLMNTTARANDALIYDYRGDGGVTVDASTGDVTTVNTALANTSAASAAVGLGTFVLGDNRETVATGGQANTNYKTYLVRRMSDGNCWMVQNLDLNLRKFAGTNLLTKENTDLTSSGRASWNPSASMLNGTGNGANTEEDDVHYADFTAWSIANLGNAQTTQFLTNTEFGLDSANNVLYYWGSKCSATNTCGLTDVTNNKMAQIPRSYDNDAENAAHQPAAIHYLDGTGINQQAKDTGSDSGNTSYGNPGINHTVSSWSPETTNTNDSSIMLGTRYFGDYYNWYAATAETGKRNMSESEYHNGAVAYDSICPKGWKLPTNQNASAADSWQNLIYTNSKYVTGTEGTYALADPGNNAATSQSMRLLPLSIPFTGYYSWQAAALNSRGADGHFWSSTAYNSGDHTSAYYLYFGGSYVSPQNNSNKVSGLTIRCVAR